MSDSQSIKTRNAPRDAAPHGAYVQAKTEYPLDSMISRRVQGLRDAYPTLPLPVAIAMVERASTEPMGLILGRLEDALDALNVLGDFGKLSGSQLRVLDVILYQILARIADLRANLQLNWKNE